MTGEFDMKKIEILGTGCPKCRALKENAETAAKEMGIDLDEVERVVNMISRNKFKLSVPEVCKLK